MDEVLGRAAAAVAEFAARPTYARSDGELRACLVDLQRLSTQVTAAMAEVTHEAAGRDLPRTDRATSTVGWLRGLLRITPAEAGRIIALAETMTKRHTIAASVHAGHVTASQATAISGVLDQTPADDAAIVDKVEATLLDEASRFDATVLRRLGDRILAHLDPEAADRALRARLEREEQQARRNRGLTLSSNGRGGTRLSGLLDAEGAAILATALDPLTRPIKGHDGPDPRTPCQRRADALVEVCRLALAAGRLPDNGGTPPQLNITIGLDALRRDLAVGQLDSGAHLTPATTRRIACTASVVPVILDGASVPIDIGRARRTFTGAARTAVLLRDGGCAFPGCDRPPRWTEIHHVVSWAHGGATNRDNGVALCGHHHRVVHHSDWDIRLGSDNHPEFIPPVHIDPLQRPRRNLYHHRT